MIKPSLPKGTRDFGPSVVRKRNYILNIIRETFELYGFQPLETPAVENLSTLTGKYGEEGDKLIFKILDNGDILGRAQQAKDSRELAVLLCEKALRYDLTIPFARFVVMHQHELAMPFRRYQVQPVWRADRPQKGRYREFYQCDADVVGSRSLFNELELVHIYAEVFRRFNLPVEIRLNNRKILSALAKLCGGSEKMTDITIAIDKLDKIGMEDVIGELQSRGLTAEQTGTIRSFLDIAGSNEEKIDQLRKLLSGIPEGEEGIWELSFLNDHLSRAKEIRSQIKIDLTLARGLNYYTGTIIEVKSTNVQIGSIGGGGRYDDLTGLFGVPGLPGVGISFGVDRIYDVLSESGLFPEESATGTRVLFFNLGKEEAEKAFELMQSLRGAGISCELYPEPVKFDKQFKYAEKKLIPYAVFAGARELETGQLTIKNLRSGEQFTVASGELNQFPF